MWRFDHQFFLKNLYRPAKHVGFGEAPVGLEYSVRLYFW